MLSFGNWPQFFKSARKTIRRFFLFSYLLFCIIFVVFTSIWKIVFIWKTRPPSLYTRFSCRPFYDSIPYFHTKINITKGVKLWSDACRDLSSKQVLFSPEQFTKCDTDNKPLHDCEFENVRLEASESQRAQIPERGISDREKDGLSSFGLQIGAFRKSAGERNDTKKPIFIRNIIDLERQQLPRERSKVNALSWPMLTKKFGLVIKSGPMERCSVEIPENVILFYAYHTKNVWHLHEGLFRLWRTMRSNGLLFKNNITVIQIDKEGDAWSHKEYLDAFTGVKWLKMKDVPINSCFRKLTVVGYPQYMFDKVQADIYDVKEYRSFMLKGLKVDESVDCSSSRIEITFISRRNRRKAHEGFSVPDGDRHLLNEDSLIKEINLIKNFNANAYSFETLTKQEQIKVSCRSTVLIGVHSGGLLNALWLKPGALLLQTQVPGVEYGSHEIWNRPPLLVLQGIGYYDMEQLAKNVGAYYETVFASKFDGPSDEVARCKKPWENNSKLLLKCFNIFKSERILYTKGTDFTVEREVLLSKIHSWKRNSSLA